MRSIFEGPFQIIESREGTWSVDPESNDEEESKIDGLDSDKEGKGPERVGESESGQIPLNEQGDNKIHGVYECDHSVSNIDTPIPLELVKDKENNNSVPEGLIAENIDSGTSRAPWYSRKSKEWFSFYQNFSHDGLHFSKSFWMTGVRPRDRKRLVFGRGRQMGYHHTFEDIAIIDGFAHASDTQKLRFTSGKKLSLPEIDREILKDDFMITSKQSPLVKDGIIVHLDIKGVVLIRSYGVCPLAAALLRPVKEERRFVIVGKSEDDKLVEFPIQSDDVILIDDYFVIHNRQLASNLLPSGSLEEICKKVHGDRQFGICVALRTSTSVSLAEQSRASMAGQSGASMATDHTPITDHRQMNAIKDEKLKEDRFIRMTQGRVEWFKRTAYGGWKAYYHDRLDGKGKSRLQFVEGVIMSNREPNKETDKMRYRHESMGYEINHSTALILDGLAGKNTNMIRDEAGKRLKIPIIEEKILQLNAEDAKIPVVLDGIIIHLMTNKLLIRSYGLPPLAVVVLRVAVEENSFKIIERSEDDILVEMETTVGDIVIIGNYWILQNDSFLSEIKPSDSLENLCLDIHHNKQRGICVALRVGTVVGLGSTDSINNESITTDLTSLDLFKSWFPRKPNPVLVTEFDDTGLSFSNGVLFGRSAYRTTSGISQSFTKFGIRANGMFLFVSDGLAVGTKRDRFPSDPLKTKIDEELLRSKEEFVKKFPLYQHGIIVAIQQAGRLMVRSFGDPPLRAIILRAKTEGNGHIAVLLSEPDQYKEVNAKDGDVALIISNDHKIGDDVAIEFFNDISLKTACERTFKKYGNQRGIILAGRIMIDDRV